LFEQYGSMKTAKLSSPSQWAGNRVMIAGSGGNGVAVDLSPGPDGVHGQVLAYGDGGQTQKVLFNSLTEMMLSYLDIGGSEVSIWSLVPGCWMDLHPGIGWDFLLE
jgi:cell wall assembly regulator SMI1